MKKKVYYECTYITMDNDGKWALYWKCKSFKGENILEIRFKALKYFQNMYYELSSRQEKKEIADFQVRLNIVINGLETDILTGITGECADNLIIETLYWMKEAGITKLI